MQQEPLAPGKVYGVSLLSTTLRKMVSLTFGDGGEALTKCAVSPAEQVALGPQASACQAIQGHTAGRSPHTAPCKLGNTRLQASTFVTFCERLVVWGCH